ncbi:MAG TPA: hypothetical protein VHV79_10905 [Mycobacteriales bacterium]|jgi:hypothetical protein|nr:hypothetical protein [Mycobacteriales bacterium]
MNTLQFAKGSAAAGGIGVLCIVVSGIGVAVAATGGSLVLGHANTATATTTLSNSHGTPLSLKAKHGKPPLQVNSKTLVKNLNAARVGSRTPKQLEATGSGAQLKVSFDTTSPAAVALIPATGTSPNLRFHAIALASTAKLPAGTYAVTATAAIEQALCWIGTTPGGAAQQYGLSLSNGTLPVSVSETATVKVKKHQRIREYCAGDSATSGDVALTAGLTAVSLGSSTPGVTAKPSATDQ